jgi:hypothetical protein
MIGRFPTRPRLLEVPWPSTKDSAFLFWYTILVGLGREEYEGKTHGEAERLQ